MTKLKPVSLQEAVDVLNRIHEADPTVLPALIDFRVPCNKAVADDPTVQVEVRRSEGNVQKFQVGFLGMLNGIFGVQPENGSGWIAAHYDGDEDDLGNLTHFSVIGE